MLRKEMAAGIERQAPVRGCFWLYEDIEVVIHEDRDFHPVRGPEGYIGHGHHVLVVFNR